MTFLHGTSMLQYIDAVGDPKGRGRVLLHDQDCAAVLPDLLDGVKGRVEVRKMVESRCGAVALGCTYLFPPLSSGGALVV